MWLDTGLVNFAANIQTGSSLRRPYVDGLMCKGAIAVAIVVAQQLQVRLMNSIYFRLAFLGTWTNTTGSNAETDFKMAKGNTNYSG